jgi:hypothetical protein
MRAYLVGVTGAAIGLVAFLTGSCALDRNGSIPGDAAAGGASTGPSTGGEVMMACDTAADCPAPDEGCGEPHCNASHTCVPELEGPGTPCSGGICDGSGNCVECIDASMCAPGQCTCSPDCAQTGGESCMGGTCTMVRTMQCGAFVCNAAGTQCLDSCTNNTGCSPGHHCNAMGLCVPPEPDGAPCGENSDCLNEHCDQNFCCNVSCDGTCERCDLPNLEGTCSPLAALSMEVTCPTGVCEGDGSCLACGEDLVPPGGGVPPADACNLPDNVTTGVCPINCNGTTCTITCQESQDCQSGTITCPPDYACVVQCLGDDSCHSAAIECPESYACDVQCPGGQGRCRDAIVTCPSLGTCHLQCDGQNTCQDTDFNCGLNSCDIDCPNGGNGQQINCAQSCSCTGGCP